jgi:uncharacterized protein (DUF927 family)
MKSVETQKPPRKAASNTTDPDKEAIMSKAILSESETEIQPEPSTKPDTDFNCYLLLAPPDFRLKKASAAPKKVEAECTAAGWVYRRKEDGEKVAKKWRSKKRPISVVPWKCPPAGKIWTGSHAEKALARKQLSHEMNQSRESHDLQKLQEECHARGLHYSFLWSDSLPSDLSDNERQVWEDLKPRHDKLLRRKEDSDLEEADIKQYEKDLEDERCAPSNSNNNYFVTEDGIFLRAQSTDQEHTKICSAIWPVAHLRNEEGTDHALLIRVFDGEREHVLSIYKRTILKYQELTELLADRNQTLPLESTNQRHLQRYLQGLNPQKKMCSVSKPGWHQGAYVFPDGEIIGKLPGHEGIYLTLEKKPDGVGTKGTLQDWQDNVLKLVKGNSRPLFCMGLSFAGLAMHLVDLESGGINIFGDSSSGKTTSARAGTGVVGHPKNYEKKWRATTNGLEGFCVAHHDSILALDELGESNAKAAAEAAYFITGGKSKGRMTKEGKLRSQESWNVLIVSTGEVELSTHISAGGKDIKAGQAVRIVDIPADVKGGYGCFETKHGYSDGKSYADALNENIRKYYGTAGREFLSRLIENGLESSREFLIKECDAFVANNSNGLSNQTLRVASRFGHILASLKYARLLGIFADILSDDDLEDSVKKMFEDWLGQRGGGGNLEPKQIVDHFVESLERYRESKFCRFHPTDKEPLARSDVWGWRDKNRFYIQSGGFKALCKEKGWSTQKVGTVLENAGLLILNHKQERSYAEHIPSEGKSHRVRILMVPEVESDDD